MNVVAICGRLTATPELKQTPNGTDVCSFTVAVQSQSKNADGSYKADFINCVAWRSTALFISRYFTKGQNIGISGSISTRTYTESDTDKKRTVFEVVANNAHFVENKKVENKPTADIPALDDFSAVADDSGDLPF